VFAIDLCAYAVMSNHYHIVVRIDAEKAENWSDHEVAVRWTRLFNKPLIIQRYLSSSSLTGAQRALVSQMISIWRNRLQNLSWYMRSLNEPVARMANREDECTGRFWEGRFKSQALLDERALMACMAYVDLNPIRAGLAKTPESSDYTSIQDRIGNPETVGLMAFSDQTNQKGIPFTYKGYLELVDWAGREVKSGKKGSIPASTPPIIARLNMSASPLLDYLKHTEDYMPVALGPVSQLRIFAHSVGRCFIKGLSLGSSICPEPR